SSTPRLRYGRPRPYSAVNPPVAAIIPAGRSPASQPASTGTPRHSPDRTANPKRGLGSGRTVSMLRSIGATDFHAAGDCPIHRSSCRTVSGHVTPAAWAGPAVQPLGVGAPQPVTEECPRRTRRRSHHLAHLPDAAMRFQHGMGHVHVAL